MTISPRIAAVVCMLAVAVVHPARSAPLQFAPRPTDSLQASEQYFNALHAADSSTFAQEFENEFLLLLNEAAAQMYAHLQTLAARKEYVMQYWNATNPNTLLPQNDWLLDFLRRRAHARKNFPAPAPPFVDDRGKYYLKYGKPLRRYEDFGSLDVLPNESWSYENVVRNFVVHFKHEGTVYREVQNLGEILPGRKRFDPDTEAKVMIAVARQRTSVSPVFGRLFAKWLDLNTTQLHAGTFADSRTALAIEWQQPHAILYAAAQHARAEMTHARNVVPSSAHDAINAVNAIKLQYDLTQFRAPNQETRIEVALLAPLKKNLLGEAQEPLQLEYRARLSDATFNLVHEAMTEGGTGREP